MSRDLSQNERRLAALAAIGVLWGALLLAIGFAFFFVVAVIGGLLLAATAVLQGRVIVSTLEPRVRGAGAQLRGATGAASARVGRIDWSGKREALGSRASTARRWPRPARAGRLRPGERRPPPSSHAGGSSPPSAPQRRSSRAATMRCG